MERRAVAGDIVANLTANTQGFTSGLNAATGSLGSFASFANNSSSGIVASFGTLAASVAAAAAAVGIAFGGISAIKFGIGLAADAETAKIAFTTLLQSADAAGAVLGDLQNFAASTPFEFPELRDSAQKLLSFGVSTNELMDTMQKLGDIAAGSGKPLGEIASIYGKVKATGKVSLETLNQLAERSIPIYEKLPDVLGVGREEMLKMISTGKVGFADLDKALQLTVNSGGQFSGAMESQSRSLNGLWSTFKDTGSLALQGLGETIISAFDFHGLLASSISFVESIASGIEKLTPVIHGIAGVVYTAAESFLTFGGEVFTLFSGAAGMTWKSFTETAVTALAMAEYAFANWELLAELSFKKVGLSVYSFGADFAFIFTDQMPSLFSWFSDNWADVFFTAADLVATVFINIGANIRDTMTQVWEFIKSGGTSSLTLAWTPLTEGFVSAIREIPEIPKRELGAFESSLQADIDSMNGSVASGMQELVDKRMKALDAFKTPVEISNNVQLKPPENTDQNAAADTVKKKQALNDVVEIRSDAANKQLAALLNRRESDDPQQKTNALLQNTNAILRDVKTAVANNVLKVGRFGGPA